MEHRFRILNLSGEERRTARLWIHTALGLFLLAGVLAAFSPLFFASQRMQGFCSALPPGASVDDVVARAAAHGYVVSSLDGGQAVVYDAATNIGRTCDLRFSGNRLVAAK